MESKGRIHRKAREACFPEIITHATLFTGKFEGKCELLAASV